MDYKELIGKTVNEKLIRIILSKPVTKDVSKILIRPIKVKDKLVYQITKSEGTKESNTVKQVHENMDGKKLSEFLYKAVPGMFLNGLFETEEGGYNVLANKKGTITVVKNKVVTSKKESLEHNRTKNYIIKEGTKVPFMVDLGVMTPEGMVTKAKYDKFKQINRYLEFVDDVVEKLDNDKELTIIDFGCGKSYLTFALYYYLVILKKLNAKVIGLDLKTDVIMECNKLAKRYGYDNLKFIEGDIGKFEGVSQVDMVITLHACDTATDYALYKAIKWGAKVIMAVPCCQHEINKLKQSALLDGVTEYGILKDRMAAIMTDAMRANILNQNGYSTRILEFIDMEHTPKNLLIRAIKTNSKIVSKSTVTKEEELVKLAGGEITLARLLKEE